MKDGLYAKFHTSKGEILVNLEYKKTPGTVGNFVALAQGKLENKIKPQGTPYYDGLNFHRVISDFIRYDIRDRPERPQYCIHRNRTQL